MEERKKGKSSVYGLLGKDISYSFSRGYFSEKFKKLGLKNHKYINLDLPKIENFPNAIKEINDLKGINVTIPYKQDVFKYLDKIDKTARKIGAVNTIKFTKRGNLKGYNTDFFGFENSLKPLLKNHHKRALILGTGGASKAIAYVLKKNNIKYKFVSRFPKGKKDISYNDISEKTLKKHQIIINCTPIGTSPNIEKSPNIPYQFITKNHLLYDLIYNPTETTFLSKGKEKGAIIKNGLQMLELQAEKSWEIWNS